MSRGIQRFRLTEIKRVMRAAKAEGLEVVRVRIGDVEVQIAAPASAAPANDDANEWDTVLAHDTPTA